MKRFGSLHTIAVLAVGALVLVLPPVPAASGDSGAETVLARVDGDAITMVDLENVLAAMEASRGAPGSTDITADKVLKRLIQNRLLEQEAYRMGADRKSEIQNQVKDLVQHKSMLALLDSVTAGVGEMTDAELDEFMGPPSTMNRIAHILVENPVTAHALLDSLADGVPFADLEDRYSRDTTYAGEGGDLGWTGEGNLIPEFENAIRGLNPGQVGKPVQTDQGWHLVQLTDVRKERLGDSDKMKSAVRDAEMRNRVMAKVRSYVASLKVKHGVVVDEKLLKSLDYGSQDEEYQDQLRESKEVLVTLGKRPFTVEGLTFKIRFKHFHGLEGKENTDAIRDEIFNEWLTESLLRYEAVLQGFPNKPEIAAAGENFKRQLLREEVLSLVMEAPFNPTEDEIADYYASNLDKFTPVPRIKLDGVFLADRDAAVDFREKLEAGAQVSWLADRTPGVSDSDPEVFIDWMEPSVFEQLGLEMKKGVILGPFVLRESWAVAKVEDIETVSPTPLAECTQEVMKIMKGERMREAVARALDQLEMQSEVVVEKDAERRISSRLEAWLQG